jgi:hypothetical protein
VLKLDPVFHLPLPVVDQEVSIIELGVDIVTSAISLAQNPEVARLDVAETVTLPVELDILTPVPAVNAVTPVLFIEIVPALFTTLIAVPADIVLSV